MSKNARRFWLALLGCLPVALAIQYSAVPADVAGDYGGVWYRAYLSILYSILFASLIVFGFSGIVKARRNARTVGFALVSFIFVIAVYAQLAGGKGPMWKFVLGGALVSWLASTLFGFVAIFKSEGKEQVVAIVLFLGIVFLGIASYNFAWVLVLASAIR